MATEHKLSEGRESMLALHGLLRRYKNLPDQISMTIGSITNPMYQKQYQFLKNCDMICSIGAKDRNMGALLTTYRGKFIKVEYFSVYSKIPDRPGVLALRSFKKVLQCWGPDKFAKSKILFATNVPEVETLMSFPDLEEQVPKLYAQTIYQRATIVASVCGAGRIKIFQYREATTTTNNFDSFDLIKDRRVEARPVKDLLAKHRIQYLIINTMEKDPLDKVCDIQDDGRAEEEFQELLNSKISCDFDVTKVIPPADYPNDDRE